MFDYMVLLKGLETIPLRTSKDGALGLIGSFYDGSSPTPQQILEQVNEGNSFKTDFIQILLTRKETVATVAAVKAKKAPIKKTGVKKSTLAEKAVSKKAVSKTVRQTSAMKRLVSIRERLKGRVSRG